MHVSVLNQCILQSCPWSSFCRVSPCRPSVVSSRTRTPTWRRRRRRRLQRLRLSPPAVSRLVSVAALYWAARDPDCASVPTRFPRAPACSAPDFRVLITETRVLAQVRVPPPPNPAAGRAVRHPGRTDPRTRPSRKPWPNCRASRGSWADWTGSGTSRRAESLPNNPVFKCIHLYHFF